MKWQIMTSRPEVEAFDLSHILKAIRAMPEAGQLPKKLLCPVCHGRKNTMPADKAIFDFYVQKP
ncbi:MAG: hypothetical protein U5K75_03885 [Ahrensia sp.]|nr:hypothetical protein [Ahrensia sp.]